MRVRSDCGSENTTIATCQMAFRHHHTDCYAGSNSFIFGSSVRNSVSYTRLCLHICIILSFIAY